MPYVQGWLIEGGGGRPDQGLPGGPPGHVGGGPIVPPAPPVLWPPPPRGEVVPPIALPPPHVPIYPDGERPPHVGGGPAQPPGHVGGGPVTPPEYPSGGPVPPGGQTDPGYDRPEGGGGNYPTTGPIKPVPPGVIWPPTGPGASGKYLALVVVAVGGTGQVEYAWTVIDPSLHVGWPLPGERPPHMGGGPVYPPSGNRPDQGLPPTPEPKG